MTTLQAIDASITKEDYLLKIKDIHAQRRYIELVSQGGEDCPDDLTEDGLLEMIKDNYNKIGPIVLSIVDCDEFSTNDRIYWMSHLNSFAGYILTRSYAYKEASEMYLNAAQGLEMFEEKIAFPYSIPWDDIEKYADGVYAHATKVYGYYANTLSLLEKEGEASEAYLNNITRARINYKLVPESLEALSEVLFGAGEHFRFDRGKDALNYLREAVELLETVTSLEESIDAGDVRLLKYTDALAMQLGICGKKKEKKKLDKQLKPYEDYITWRMEFNALDLIDEESNKN